MLIRLISIIVLAYFFTAVTSLAAMRTWTSTNGQTIEAEYVRHSVGKIVLKRADGKEIAVPASYLSKEDQAYANKLVPPRLKLDFSKRALTTAEYYDDHRQQIRFTVKIEKTSRLPYDGKLKVELFVLGENLGSGGKSMLLRKVWTDVELSNEPDDVLELTPEPIVVHYDDQGGSGWNIEYGTKYDGYAFFVFDENGNMLGSRASSKNLERQLANLRSEKLYDL